MPAASEAPAASLEGFEAAVHLAGANIAGGRWTAARKRTIAASRIGMTGALAAHFARLERPPRIFISASAVGGYGDRGDEWLEETSRFGGEDFLAGLAREWEAVAHFASRTAVRIAHPRTGIVLARRAGALAPMLPLFRLGLGGRLGSGRQWWSWITLADVVAALVHALQCEDVRGPFNVVAPDPVTNAAFTRALGRVLGRPAMLPAPAFALRLALGREFADQLLLASQRVRPAVLLRTGFVFGDPELEPALRRVLAPGGAGA